MASDGSRLVACARVRSSEPWPQDLEFRVLGNDFFRGLGFRSLGFGFRVMVWRFSPKDGATRIM